MTKPQENTMVLFSKNKQSCRVKFLKEENGLYHCKHNKHIIKVEPKYIFNDIIISTKLESFVSEYKKSHISTSLYGINAISAFLEQLVYVIDNDSFIDIKMIANNPYNFILNIYDNKQPISIEFYFDHKDYVFIRKNSSNGNQITKDVSIKILIDTMKNLIFGDNWFKVR